MIEHDYSRLMDAATAQHLPVTDEQLTININGEDIRDQRKLWMSRHLKYLLILLCNGAPLTILRTAETENGFEIWRLLSLRHSPNPIANSFGMLGHILEPVLPEAHFQDAFAYWDAEIAKHERDTGAPLADSVKIAVLHNKTSGALQQHLRLNSARLQRYDDVRTVLLDYFRSLTAFRPTATPVFRPY